MSTCLGETGSVSVVELFGLDRGHVVDRFVRTLGVEPVHPVQGFDLDVLAVLPGLAVDEFALVEPDLRLGQVVGVADGPY